MNKRQTRTWSKDRCLRNRVVDGDGRLLLASATLFSVLAAVSGCASEATDCEGYGCGCDASAGPAGCCQAFLEPTGDGQCIGRAWPPTERILLGAPGVDALELTVDGLGRPLVGWRRRDAEDPFARSVLAEQTSQGWATHVLGGAEAGTGGRVTLASRGIEAWVTWSQHRRTPEGEDESSVFLWRRGSTGHWLTTGEGERLSFEPKAYEPRPLLPRSGEGLVVWNQWRHEGGYGVALAMQEPGSPTITLPGSASDALSPRFFFANAPQVAVGNNGDGMIVWYQATPTESSDSVSAGLRLFASERTRANGAFSRPAVDDWLSPAGPPLASHATRNPVVAVGDFGQALVFWSQEHPSGATALFSASRNGLGDWTTPDDIDDTFGPIREHATCIEVVLATTGEAYVTWFDGPPRATAVYTAYRDRKGDWEDPVTTQVSTDGRTAQDPRIAVGPQGEAVVVWTERGNDERWRVMGRRRGPEASGWGKAVELSDPSEGDALGPTVAIGPDGTLAAAWGAGPIGAQKAAVAILP